MGSEEKKVLLVEDEPLLGNLLKQRLAKNGFDVTLAKDGQEALDIIGEKKPDLVLLDIILPKISGFEFLEKLQSDPVSPKTPVIIVSNLGQEGDLARGESLGAVGYFVKAKVSMEDLVQKVTEFLKG